jgi:hypothetical protein
MFYNFPLFYQLTDEVKRAPFYIGVGVECLLCKILDESACRVLSNIGDDPLKTPLQIRMTFQLLQTSSIFFSSTTRRKQRYVLAACHTDQQSYLPLKYPLHPLERQPMHMLHQKRPNTSATPYLACSRLFYK